MFRWLKQRARFILSVLGETVGHKLSWCLPHVKAGIGLCSTVLVWAGSGEMSARQDEHHGLQDLLLGSTGTDNWGRRAGKRTGRLQSHKGGRRSDFSRFALFSFGEGGPFLFGVREGAQSGLRAKCFGFA